MATRGFVGFNKDGAIRGFYNHNDSSFSFLGKTALLKFKEHTIDELEKFFTKSITLVDLLEDKEDEFYGNHKIIWDLNWKVDKITLQEYSEYLFEGFDCQYGYVFNLDTDTFEVYQGGFSTPQRESEKDIFKLKETFGYKDDRSYTHLVLEITRDKIEKALWAFSNWSNLNYELRQPIKLQFY